MEAGYGLEKFYCLRPLTGCQSFEVNGQSIQDNPRPSQGHPIIMAANIQRPDELLRDHRRLLVVSISHGSAHIILHDILHYRKVFAPLVP